MEAPAEGNQGGRPRARFRAAAQLTHREPEPKGGRKKPPVTRAGKVSWAYQQAPPALATAQFWSWSHLECQKKMRGPLPLKPCSTWRWL